MSSVLTHTNGGIKYHLTATLANDGIYYPLDYSAKEELVSLAHTEGW